MPSTESVKVAVRVRPFSQREKNSGSKCVISMHSRTTTIIQDPKNPGHTKTFTFDLAYWSHSGFQKDKDGVFISADPGSKFAGQKEVFHDLGRGILDSAWQGYNTTLLAYGQTGSGKSYSMIGFGANKGIIPNVCEELFQAIENRDKNQEYQVLKNNYNILQCQLLTFSKNIVTKSGLTARCSKASIDDCTIFFFFCLLILIYFMLFPIQVTFSMLEIYNEQPGIGYPALTYLTLTGFGKGPLVGNGASAKDSKQGNKKISLGEDQQLGFYVDGLQSVPCENYAQIERLMEQGAKIRTTASTNMNASSSRSHMVITIQFKQVFPDRGLTKQSSINLVDLAGSERQKSSGSEGDRLREGSRVNLSLTNLGNVISALADAAMGKKVLHVPYRDSVLTKLLQSALGGNSRTTLVNIFWVMRSLEDWEQWIGRNFALCALLPRLVRIPSLFLLQEQQMIKTFPHLLNVSEDPQLTGVLKHFIQAGSCDAGKAASNAITLQGLGISEKHASFTNSGGKDRIILGSNSAYLYIGFPSERGSEDLSRFDYDFFQLERAAAEGVSADKLGAVNSGDGKADPSVLAVFQDYVKLMPLVAEANQMSEELKKVSAENESPSVERMKNKLQRWYVLRNVKLFSERCFSYQGLNMELKVKNLASSDSRGCDLQKEVTVKVTHQRTHQVWIWSKAKFINRKFLMEELYQRFLDGEDSQVAQEDDPFWDPVEVVHLGSAHIWLQSLAYCMKFEEQVEFLNCDGLEEAVLHIHIKPCSPTGQARGEEDVVTDPVDLLGKRMDFQIRLVQCLGTKWLKEDAERGVQMGYRIYDLPNTLYTKPVWKIVNPQIDETVQFTTLNASQEFLNYLQTNALIVDLWGLQEGCAELSCSRLDLMVTGEGHILVD
ncbi:hypothetical protein M91_03817, partial [Bos mutus]